MVIRSTFTSIPGQRLWHAMERGNERTAISLIHQHGLTGTLHPSRGYYPLSAAATWGQAGVVRALLEKGANPQSRDANSQDTPLYSAISGGGGRKQGTEIIRLLLEAGANPNYRMAEKAGASIFLLACGRGMRDAVGRLDLMLEHGARVDAVDFLGRGALHYACDAQPATIRFLAKAGASATLQDEEGNTPLHATGHGGSKTCFQAMLRAGADPRTRNSAGLLAQECGVREADDKADPLLGLVAQWHRTHLRKTVQDHRPSVPKPAMRGARRKM